MLQEGHVVILGKISGMTARQKKLIQGCCIFNIFIILGYARDGKGIYIMNYAEIKECDVANGPGVRVSLFVSGCTHHCKECFNPETWDFNSGKEWTEEVKNKFDVAYKQLNIEKVSKVNKIILVILGISLMLNIINFVTLLKMM